MTKSNQHDQSEIHPGCRELRAASHQLGVSNSENLPFYLCPPEAKTAALLVHGFTATPWEMRLLAEFLAESGIASLGIRLPGHGTSPEDLARCRWEDWRDCITNGFKILNENFRGIYGMGMSTGCLLLVQSATRLNFRGLVLFSPYLRIMHRLAPFAGLLRWIQPYHLRDMDRHLEDRYYKRRPLAGIYQINRLVKSVRQNLPDVTCPVMAFNGEGDQTVDIKTAKVLMAALGSKVKIHEVFGREVPHVLTREENPCRGSMFTQTCRFVQEIEDPGEPVVVR